MNMLTIGKLAGLSGVSADTLRFYEREGLVAPEGRTEAGYRLYDPEAARRVIFIKKAQSLGFTLAEARQLLEYRGDDHATAGEVHKLAEAKVEEFRVKIAEMQRMIDTLENLVDLCPGEGPIEGCPIVDHLYPAQNGGALKKAGE